MLDGGSDKDFIKDEYIHSLRLESKLSDLREGYANSTRTAFPPSFIKGVTWDYPQG